MFLEGIFLKRSSVWYCTIAKHMQPGSRYMPHFPLNRFARWENCAPLFSLGLGSIQAGGRILDWTRSPMPIIADKNKDSIRIH